MVLTCRLFRQSRFTEMGLQSLSAFIPLKLDPNDQARAETLIRICVSCEPGQLKVHWPTNDPEGCARFLH